MAWNLRQPRSTGVRDLRGLVTGVESGNLTVIRVGHTVTLSLDTLVLTGDGWSSLCTLPAGFRPPVSCRENLIGADHGAQLLINTSGSIWSNRKSGYTYRSTITYVTENPWPTSLPGKEL